MATESFVGLPADSVGKKLRTVEVTTSQGVVEQEVVTLAKSDGTLLDTVPVSAVSLPLPSGAATETTLGTRLSESDFDTKVGSLTETAPASDTASSGLNGRLQRVAQRLTSLIGLLPASLGQKTSAGSLAVTIASDQSAVPVSQSSWVPAKSATGTLSNVSGSATSVTILAANASRVGATVFNDSTASLYLAFTASAASTSAFTVKVSPGAYYELPTSAVYTGQITGIWSSATGAARVTELT